MGTDEYVRVSAPLSTRLPFRSRALEMPCARTLTHTTRHIRKTTSFIV